MFLVERIVVFSNLQESFLLGRAIKFDTQEMFNFFDVFKLVLCWWVHKGYA